MRNVIIFGAGASYGSEEDKDIVPPLGINLIAKLNIKIPQTAQLIKGLEDVFKDDFERGMVELGNKLPHNLPVLQRILAAYFFDFFLTSTSVYLKLISRIHNYINETAFVTLNYERLLFMALNNSGLTPVVNSMPFINQALVCIPHGICHLFCNNARGDANGISMNGKGVKLNGKIECIDDKNKFTNRIKTDAFPPVMSYFEPQKETLSGSNFIYGQRQQYVQLISNAKKIVIIGVKLRKHDSHIWQSLSSTKAKVLYCSGNDGKEYKKHFQDNPLRKNDTILPGYFRESLNEISQFLG